MLEYDVSPKEEAQLDVVELDLDWESPSSVEQQKILVASPGSQKKQKYWVLEGKKPIQSPH